MICWINPFTGLAGDMLLGALIDAGAPLHRMRAAVESTGLTGFELTAARVVEHGLAATRVHVDVTDDRSERRAAELIESAARAQPQQVAAPEVVCAPLPLGTGSVRSAHGVIPCPAPATLALLSGAAVTGTAIPGETVTPTGAALLVAARTRYGPPPLMTVAATGYGAGTRRLADRPNVTAVTIGHPAESQQGAAEHVVVLSTNLDDVTGEVLGHTISRALEAGALDAWATPAVMKKGRPAHVLHVMAPPEAADQLSRLVLAETGSLGIRQTAAGRVVLPRTTRTVDVNGCAVRVKCGPYGAKPEHDDVAAASTRLGLPLRTVARHALQACAGVADDEGEAR
ncbi:LarC family nickel insertion protein [Nonomuraea sp. NPDC049269]|uniref:LarC family nickel insertion protein n=1 Tax=Nonomuraea sp. NPDC049269 TaxID=3364349 RepID=UPI003714FE55